MVQSRIQASKMLVCFVSKYILLKKENAKALLKKLEQNQFPAVDLFYFFKKINIVGVY